MSLADPEALKVQQKDLCTSLNLNGRILISHEGINGTVAGLENEINEYMETTSSLPEFNDMEWKISWAAEQVFPKLRVLVRDEIVTLGVRKSGSDVNIANKAQYIEPHELQQLYDHNKEFVIIDARNGYEAEVGKFKNAVIAPIENFRDFPAFVKRLDQFKDKEVITYCTGGVRCEKASAYLREQGFQNVRQLHGGIHEYGEQTGGKYFEGEMFVFDKRLHVPVNTVDPSIISHCVYCQVPITRYIDCTVENCVELFICCSECEANYQGRCLGHADELTSSSAATHSTTSP